MNTLSSVVPSLDILVPLMFVGWWLPVNGVWNGIVFAGTLSAQRVLHMVSVKRGVAYVVVTTLVGGVVDTVWQIGVVTASRLPGGRIPSGAYLRAMPIAGIASAGLNFLLAAGILRLPWKRAAILGVAMGLLTAPWTILLL